MRLGRSLRHRLAVLTVLGLMLALLAAGVVLQGLFEQEVRGQFQQALMQQLDQLTARLSVDEQGRPSLDTAGLSDPRWTQPYSGLYWQVDEVATDGRNRQAMLRSRSLWDQSLPLDADALPDGSVHVHPSPGPQGASLMVLERTVQWAAGAVPGGLAGSRWRLIVAADTAPMQASAATFRRGLVWSLLALGLLLGAAMLAQQHFGLRPLTALQRGLSDVRTGRQPLLAGDFPQEVQPLVDDFNQVLQAQRGHLERARTQAGNLAHALKTPLAVMQAAAQRAGQDPQARQELPSLVDEQVARARHQVDAHLRRARAAALVQLPGQRTAVAPVLQGLLRVMGKVHADRNLVFEGPEPLATDLAFAGDEQDLQEIAGNLLDNACKWARQRIQVRLQRSDGVTGAWLTLCVDDDGPGVPEADVARMLARGGRLDESVPGSGLGLDIVRELVALHGGQLTLGRSDLGGLRAQVQLPVAPTA